jgi:integrase
MAFVQDTWFTTGADGRLQPTSRHGHGKRYKARWTDLDGRERSKSFPDRRKGDAERFLVEVEHSLNVGTYLDPDAGRVTLRRKAGEWLGSRTGDPTTNNLIRQRVNKHIVPALGDRRLDQLARSPSIVQAWVAGLEVAPSYARQLLGHLSAIMDTAVADSIIPRNPCRDVTVRPPRAVRRKVVPLAASQAAAVRAALPPRFRAMCDCGTDLGLRQGECFGLAVEDIDFLRRVVHVRTQVKMANGTRPIFALPKGGKTRDVPLPHSAAVALAEHIRLFPPREITLPWRAVGGKPATRQLVFTGVRGRAVDRWSFNRDAWKPALRAARLPVARETGMHVLRHTFASSLLRGKIDVRRLAEWLGHSTPAITLATYSHLMPGTADKDLADIEAALAAREQDVASTPPGPLTAHEDGVAP